MTTQDTPGLARQAARAALGLAHGDIDDGLKAKAALVLRDFLGCCLEASRSPAGRRMTAFAGRDAGAGADALVGGMLGHALIREDMHVPSGTHPGVVILPAMLALARREGLDGQALVRGIVAGYHLMGTLGIAARSGLAHRHFRPLGISGPFGAAAGAIAAVGCDEETAVNALAFAANFAGGLNQWPWAGGQEIYVHAGMAARNGLAALDLARCGLRASPDILEGEDGLFAAIGSGPDAATLFVRRLAGPSCLLEVTHKPVAGCNYVQTAAAAALSLLDGGAAPDIRRIVISTFTAARSYPGCDSTGPFDHVEQRKMSFQYAIAAALRHGRLDDDSYAEPDDAELRRLIGVTEIRIDPVFELRTMPAQPARVELVLADGRTLRAELPDVPWLDAAAVRQRFEREAMPGTGTAGFARLAALVDGLWDARDLSALWEYWPGPRPA
nr:hypothetical protein [uncultured bacterium]